MATGRWAVPLYKPSYPRIVSKSYSRDNDITFSLGKPTDYEEVLHLLWKAGCVEDPLTLSNKVNQLRITRNLDNGQVFVTCAESGVADKWVDSLNELENTSIKKCHSYTNKEIPVKFSYLHASIDIENDIVNGFLKGYGRVKEWFPLKDKQFGIPNGSFIFVMYEEDLQNKPLPECMFVNHMQVWISYRTQVTRCHTCNEEGHYSRECPKKNVDYPGLHANQGASPFLAGKFPGRKDGAKKDGKSHGTVNNANPASQSALEDQLAVSEVILNGLGEEKSGDGGSSTSASTSNHQKNTNGNRMSSSQGNLAVQTSFTNGQKAALSSAIKSVGVITELSEVVESRGQGI